LAILAAIDPKDWQGIFLDPYVCHKGLNGEAKFQSKNCLKPKDVHRIRMDQEKFPGVWVPCLAFDINIYHSQRKLEGIGG